MFSICGRLGHDAGPAFGALVLAKHAVGAATSWGAPRLLERSGLSRSSHSEGIAGTSGLLQVQLVLLLPHALALCAGLYLAITEDASKRAVAHRDEKDADQDVDEIPPVPKQSSVLSCEGAAGGSPRSSSVLLGEPCDSLLISRLRAGLHEAVLLDLTVLLIGLWRAFEVATLHAYHSVRVELLVSTTSLPLVDAGTFFAQSDLVAIATLPLFVCLSRSIGFRPLVIVAPLLGIAAITLYMLHSHSDSPPSVMARADLLVMSVLEVGAPIVPLALLPMARESNRRDHTLGAAYGVIESLFIAAQVGLIMLLGLLRSYVGNHNFVGPMSLMGGGFATASAVSFMLVAHGPTRFFCGQWPRHSRGSRTLQDPENDDVLQMHGV